MNKEPLISIVIPMYNVEKYICNALEAVKNQTYSRIETVLVDDGCSDNSVAIAKKKAEEINLDVVIIHQENQGLSAARNTGIEKASGEWVLCLDADDYIHKYTLANMMTLAKKYKTSCVFCGYKSVDEEHLKDDSITTDKVYCENKETALRDFLNRKIQLLVTGMLAKRSIYDKLHFDVNCPYDEDIHFLWQLVFEQDRIVLQESEYYNYLTREGSMVHSLSIEKMKRTLLEYESTFQNQKYESNPITKAIVPKYILGSTHVLSKCVSKKEFLIGIKMVGKRTRVLPAIVYGNFKLKLMGILYICIPAIYYELCRRG